MTTGDPLDATLVPLSIEACWELLGTVPVGRVAFEVAGEAPLVLPVNHLVQRKTIVFRTGPGTKRESAPRQLISFQADAYDQHLRQGWSVLVRGVASIETVDGDELEPWAGRSGRSEIVRIWPEHVTGRRIQPGHIPYEPKGYL